MGSITTLSELIEAEPEDTDLFPLLIDSSRRAMQDVLYHRDLSAAESGKLEAEPELFEARPFLENLIETECRFKNTQPSLIRLNMEDGPLTLFSDKRLLRHVLRNMLTNALEAADGQTGSVGLTCRSADGWVSLSMENPGVIPEEIQKEMFKRYVSTKSRDRGLGTYVIKLLTENHLHGTVRFASGNGTTRFEIALPITAGGTA